MDSKQKLHLEEQLEELESVRGQHTELVTVMIPSGFNIHAVSNQLESERSTAENIKSKSTRHAVMDAIDMIVREIKKYKQTPPNGIAFFAGNVSEKEGTSDVKIWAIEPPKALKVRMYRCDKNFVTAPLREILQTEEVYGLLVIDRQQATIGLLEGKKIDVIRKLTSGVPGKVRAGGQCLAPDTLIMKDDGEIIEIKDSHNPLIIVAENFNTEKSEETPIIAKWENKKELFKVITCYPKFEIKASKEHIFLVRTLNGIEEKKLEDMRKGDYLLIPEKIDVKGTEQKIDFTPIIRQKFNMKEVKILPTLTGELAQILGYYLGDGNYEEDRINFSEQRKEVAETYNSLLEQYFGIKGKIRYRENKGYYQIRIGSRIIAQLFKSIFDKDGKTLHQDIPKIILKSQNSVIASFIKGFFDAEGYASKGRIAFGINNGFLTRQLQFTLLRLGIIASVNVYDNRRNPYSKKPRYTLAIDDLESIKMFSQLIGFTSQEKNKKVFDIIKERSSRNKVRQIVVNGKEVAQIIRNSGLTTTKFRCPDFFTNKKQLSKELFKKNILEKISNIELKRRLELFYNSNLIVVKIAKIESQGVQDTIDIETKSHNFIANGLVVHNSSQRFERITEGLAKEFFRRVSEGMKEIFFDMPRLKGILVGGPIPTKEEFLELGDLVTKLKEKVIAVKDIGYVDEHGLKLLVEASHDDIAEQEIVKEKKILERFFTTLGKNPNKAAYGADKVNLSIERGAAELIFLSNKLPKAVIAEFEKKAETIGAEVVIISTETQEGEQFYNITKGVGAILRFALE